MRPPDRRRPRAASRDPDALLAERERCALEALRDSLLVVGEEVVDSRALRASVRARPALAMTLALAAGALLAPVLAGAARRLGPWGGVLLTEVLRTRRAEPGGPGN